MTNIKLMFIFVIYLISLKSNDCNELPSSFPNYEIALEKVSKSHFQKFEKLNSSKSSWIEGLEFYSCNSKVGFLILKTKGRAYIHQDVPIAIWVKLKSSDSYGSFYNLELKGKYPLNIN
ncbi:MAG: KTSC domain-containing protein [Cytophagales bacterium]|nr:KTSC domain-containing protein [Cytophagales bacterium]